MQCMSCGTEMNNTTGGNYTCPKCGQSINDGVYRPSTSNTYGEPYLGWGQMGWICPKCGKVLAPWRAECDCHKRNTVTTDKSNITDKSNKPFITGTSINNKQTPNVSYTTAINVNKDHESIFSGGKLHKKDNNNDRKNI